MRKNSIAAIGALLAVLVAAGVGAAAKPSSNLNLVVVGSTGAAAATQPTYGGQITFNVSTTETSQPQVNVRCYQSGIFVYDAWRGFWSTYYTNPVFTLSSGYWTGGAADCTARLVAFDKQGREQTLASMDFHVNA